MPVSVETPDPLRSAAVRFGDFIAGWPVDTESENGLTRGDAEVVSAHVDLVLLFSGPDVPPIALEPEDDGVVATAFDHLDGLIAAWPADRIDPVSKLTRDDLALIARQRGPVGPRHPAGPPQILD